MKKEELQTIEVEYFCCERGTLLFTFIKTYDNAMEVELNCECNAWIGGLLNIDGKLIRNQLQTKEE